MDKTVRVHIDLLESRLELLINQQMAAKSKAKLNEIERDIRAVKMALAHFRAALDLEKGLRK